MSVLRTADRLLTIAVTAAITSAGWLIYGNSSFRRVEPAPSDVFSTSSDAPGQEGASVAQEDLRIPVRGVNAGELVDSFTEARASGERSHLAIDIMAPAGTQVLAAASGKVESLFASDDGGNTIYVRSPDRRTLYYYAHLQNYAVGLREGQTVGRGQELGRVGSSGNADAAAPHLHFAIMRTSPNARWWDAGRYEDPFPLLGGRAQR